MEKVLRAEAVGIAVIVLVQVEQEKAQLPFSIAVSLWENTAKFFFGKIWTLRLLPLEIYF